MFIYFARAGNDNKHHQQQQNHLPIIYTKGKQNRKEKQQSNKQKQIYSVRFLRVKGSSKITTGHGGRDWPYTM